MVAQHTSTLLSQLRMETWHRHEGMERLPFVQALVDGTLPLQSYIGQLRGFAVLFATLRTQLSILPEPLSGHLQASMQERFAMLCDDLSYFAGRMVPDIVPATGVILEAASRVRLAPVGSLLGYIYVLQGTMRGNQVHLPDIVKCFDLDERGTRFYRGYGDGTDYAWHEFRTIVNVADVNLAPEAIEGAQDMYDHLVRFHTLLYPIPEQGSGYAASGLNPEAGDHPVPQDPAVLAAALTAGNRCREEFPYFEQRYGERGRRFTDSDVAWLAALAGRDEAEIVEQVLWLGRVLSFRGMPVFLLERQLEILLEELSGLPGAGPLDGLAGAIGQLRRTRLQLADQERFELVSRRVSDLLEARGLSWLAVVLVAAQADLKAGMPECRQLLELWLADQHGLCAAELNPLHLILEGL